MYRQETKIEAQVLSPVGEIISWVVENAIVIPEQKRLLPWEYDPLRCDEEEWEPWAWYDNGASDS